MPLHAVGILFAVVVTGQDFSNLVVQSFIQALCRNVARSHFKDGQEDCMLFQAVM